MNLKGLMASILVLVMIFSLAACGGSNNASSDAPATISTADQQEVINNLAQEAADVPKPDTQIIEGTTSPDSTAPDTENKLLGEWADINDATRIVKVTKNGEEYQYADPDGTYNGTMKDGILTIKISDAENDTAMVFIDSKTGNLVTNYQGDIYEFTKKVQ